jgi:hypothetical protein
MSPKLLSSSSFFLFVFLIDQDLAALVRAGGCPCGGRLHVANYHRKPRGVPDDLPESFTLAFSFSCDRDGCRKRATAPSVRFLERKVYVGLAVVLVIAMRQGLTPYGERQVRAQLGIDRRTVERWRRYWLESFPARAAWQELRGLLPSHFDATRLPLALLEHFGAAASDDPTVFIRTFLRIAGVAYARLDLVTLWDGR